MRSKAYRSFTERLLAREILPGQFVSQRELVAITGLPLGAIRELIPRLEAEGIITTVPKRGMQVAHVDNDLIRNAFELRKILELSALREFCRTAAPSTISDIEAEHRELASGAQREITPELISRAQAIDWGFHDTIIDHLGNKLISGVYQTNSIKIRIIRGRETRILPELFHEIIREHMRIVTALIEGDEDAAVEALADHIDSARNRALGL